jgi:competence protein ComEA
VDLRERIDALSRAELAGLILVVVAVVAGAGLWYVRSLPRPVTIAASAAPSPGAAATRASPSVAPLIVDVAGWVVDPGVYEFAPGDRVIDAIERAGGPRRNADLAALNLAAPLADGTQILVPKAGGATAGGATSGSTSGGLVNINSADATALESLSGIGEVLAGEIVAYREEHGPFTSVDQLEDVSGIGPATLEEIRDQVTV